MHTICSADSPEVGALSRYKYFLPKGSLSATHLAHDSEWLCIRAR